MFKTVLITLILAVLAGAGGWFGWRDNKALSVFLWIAALVCAVISLTTAFVGAVGVIFKILPIIVIVAAVYVLVRRAVNDRD